MPLFTNEHSPTFQQAAADARTAVDKRADLTPLATGLGNNYYRLPEGCTDIQDLIECKDMSFSIANIFKACYRLGQKKGTTTLYDLEKIKWFIEREIAREKGNKCQL